MNETLHVQYLRDALSLYAPGLAYATEGAAGLDLRACPPEDQPESITIAPGRRAPVPTGLAVQPPQGLAGFVLSRSGLGAKQGLTVAQGVGLIDPDYRGEITVYLLNTSTDEITIKKGDRIAQLVYMPFARLNVRKADKLDDTGRGAGGFGHTGA